MTASSENGVKPELISIEKKGGRILWCACGRSEKQPLCDGSHKGTPYRPVPYTAGEDNEEVLLCVCKQTKNPPFCDGSHNNLEEGYALASADEIARSAHFEITGRDAGAFGRAVLDGGCFVLTPKTDASHLVHGWTINSVIDAQKGAARLSQYILRPGVDAASISFGESEAVLFVTQGNGLLTDGQSHIAIESGCAITIIPGEYFLIQENAANDFVAIATVCPPCASVRTLKKGASRPAIPFAERIRYIDESKRQSMGERFYQVLADHMTGAGQLTQFIGEIPKSRAAAHRHLYEEAIYILSGEGYLWTDNARAIVKPGDVIYLPRKQYHSLECTSDGGMKLAGAFFPAGSPAINY